MSYKWTNIYLRYVRLEDSQRLPFQTLMNDNLFQYKYTFPGQFGKHETQFVTN